MALEFAWVSGGSGPLVSEGARRAEDLDRPAVVTLAHRPSVPASIDGSRGDQLDAEPAAISGRLRRTRRFVPLPAGQPAAGPLACVEDMSTTQNPRPARPLISALEITALGGRGYRPVGCAFWDTLVSASLPVLRSP
jgi:hypothetical protein